MKNNSAEQSYAPWRQAILTKEELLDLSRPNFELNVRKAVMLWLQIIICWAIAAWAHDSSLSASWAWIAFCACLVGNRYYALYIMGHDGLHRRLHPNIKINDLFNDLMCIGPIGAVTHRNRTNHMKHHRHFATSEDPDAYKYASRHSMGAGEFALSLTALPFVWRAVANVYRLRAGQESANLKSNKLTVRDLVIIIGWQALLLTGLTLAFGCWGYVVMWLAPIYVFTFATDMARVYCEHSLEDDLLIENLPNTQQWVLRCVTFMPGWLELALFAPLNMNHHAVHHLWPSIAWHNLPHATKLLSERIQAQVTEEGLPVSFQLIRCSYIGWLLSHRA